MDYSDNSPPGRAYSASVRDGQPLGAHLGASSATYVAPPGSALNAWVDHPTGGRHARRSARRYAAGWGRPCRIPHWRAPRPSS